jgi:hypothetical protein
VSELLSEQIKKGISVELRSLLYFTEKGYLCSIPYGNAGRYDLLVDTGKKIVRIQCKSAHKNNNGSYTVNTSNTAMKAIGNIRKFYTKDEIDYIITFIEDQAVFISVEMIEHTQSKTFRVGLPKYGTKTNCNLIQDYTFEKIFDN